MFVSWLMFIYNAIFDILEHRYLKLPALANGGQVGPEQGTFDDMVVVQKDRAHVKGMKIWIRRWDGRPVLGGRYSFSTDLLSFFFTQLCPALQETCDI